MMFWKGIFSEIEKSNINFYGNEQTTAWPFFKSKLKKKNKYRRQYNIKTSIKVNLETNSLYK